MGRPPGARWRNGESRPACERAAGRWVIELNGTERGVAVEGSGLAESGGMLGAGGAAGERGDQTERTSCVKERWLRGGSGLGLGGLTTGGRHRRAPSVR